MWYHKYGYGLKESLLKSVDMSTLLYMRNVEHMTNREIAQRLDVSTATIRKYIGPMGKKKKTEEA